MKIYLKKTFSFIIALVLIFTFFGVNTLITYAEGNNDVIIPQHSFEKYYGNFSGADVGILHIDTVGAQVIYSENILGYQFIYCDRVSKIAVVKDGDTHSFSVAYACGLFTAEDIYQIYIIYKNYFKIFPFLIRRHNSSARADNIYNNHYDFNDYN